MNDMKIGVRLGLAFAGVLFLMTVMAVSSYYLINKIDNGLDHIVTNNQVRAFKSYEALLALNGAADSIRTYILLDNQSVRDHSLLAIQDLRTKYKEAIGKIDELDKTDKGIEIIKRLKEVVAPAAAANNKALELAQQGKQAEAVTVLVNEGMPLTEKTKDLFAELAKYQKERAAFRHAEASRFGDQARLTAVIIGIASLLIGIIAAIVITRSITRPIADLVAMNDRLASGDLTVKIVASGKDEVGQLAESSRNVVENIRNIVGMISDTSNQVAAASIQLQGTAQQIANGAEEVANQTGTVATASEEMSATSGDIAHNCALAAESSQQSNASAKRGEAVVQETTAVMTKIAKSVKQSAQTVSDLGTRSEQIGQIVGTIEDIADQTNLLALNAAIEAARAGEQGRGFAVVADEVRALAERTTKATREISEMIKAIQGEIKIAVGAMEEGVSDVASGAESSEKSRCALEEILEQISEVTMQINQIATAAEQQTATTNDITMNVQQITNVVYETARGATETATASAQLASNATILQGLVRQFKLA